MMPNSIFLCLGVLGALGLIVGMIILLRYLSYRETLALAEKGIVRQPRESDGKLTLRWGIILTAVGLALCLGLYPLGAVLNAGYALNFGPWMLFGLIPFFFGLGLILIYVLTKK